MSDTHYFKGLCPKNALLLHFEWIDLSLYPFPHTGSCPWVRNRDIFHLSDFKEFEILIERSSAGQDSPSPSAVSSSSCPPPTGHMYEEFQWGCVGGSAQLSDDQWISAFGNTCSEQVFQRCHLDNQALSVMYRFMISNNKRREREWLCAGFSWSETYRDRRLFSTST